MRTLVFIIEPVSACSVRYVSVYVSAVYVSATLCQYCVRQCYAMLLTWVIMACDYPLIMSMSFYDTHRALMIVIT